MNCESVNKKMYVLKVTTFQLAILHQFNTADKLTTEQIKELTALDEKGEGDTLNIVSFLIIVNLSFITGLVYYLIVSVSFRPELIKQLKPCIENDVLKVISGNGGDLSGNVLLQANDDFVKRGTTVKLVPSNKGILNLSETKM